MDKGNMVWIPPGWFPMGSSSGFYPEEQPVHEVDLVVIANP